MFYKYKHLEPSSIKYYIKEELCSNSESDCWNARLRNEVLERFFFPFCSLKLDVLHMISSLCGSCSKYLTASRKQEPTTSKVQHKTGMTEHWHAQVRARSRMSFNILCLIKLFNTEAPSNSNTGSQNKESGEYSRITDYLYGTKKKLKTFPKSMFL